MDKFTKFGQQILENNSKPSCKYQPLLNMNENGCFVSDEEESISNETEFNHREAGTRSKITSIENPFYNVNEYIGTQNFNTNNNNNNPCTSKMAAQRQCTEQTRNSVVNMLTRIVRSAFDPQKNAQAAGQSTKRATSFKSSTKKPPEKNLSIENIQMRFDENNGDKIQLSLLIPANCFKKEELAALKNKKCVRIPRGVTSSLSNEYCSSDDASSRDKINLLCENPCSSKQSERKKKKKRPLTNANEYLKRSSPVDSVSSKCYFDNHDFNANDENSSHSISCCFVLFVIFATFANILFGKNRNFMDLNFSLLI
jgi:hypothetical protein